MRHGNTNAAAGLDAPADGFPLRRLTVFTAWAGIVLFAYSLERLEFLGVNWGTFSRESGRELCRAMLLGLRFDLAFVLMMASPLLVLLLLPFPRGWRTNAELPRWFTVTFLVLQLPWLLVNFIDAHYYRFSGRRSSLNIIKLSKDVSDQAAQLALQYWFIPVLAVAGGTLLYLSLRKVAATRGRGRVLGWKAWIPLVLVAVGLCFLGIRGGLQTKPLRPTHAYSFSSVGLGDLALNTPYIMSRTKASDSVPMVKFLPSQAEVDALTERDHALVPHFPPSKDNVVIVILESFGLEFMGEPNHRASLVPFLESLSRRGLFFVNNHANGRRSIEAVPAILAGIPSLMDEPYATSRYVGNRMHGLGEILAARGYRTSFFHGGTTGTMYFDQMSHLAGYKDYYGKEAYPDRKDFDGAWGIYDGPFLQFMRAKLDQTPQPFAATVFTLSSHNPYPVPAEFKAKLDPRLTPFQRSLVYSDHALQEFFRAAEKSPWYKNTLFVLTADHTSESTDPAYQTLDGRYRVPLLFFHGGGRIEPAKPTRITQHVDILPSVLDFLGIPSSELGYRMLPFGRSVFDAGRPGLALNHASGTFWLKRDSGIATFRLADAAKGTNAVDPTLLAYIQLFNNGSNENSWYQGPANKAASANGR